MKKNFTTLLVLSLFISTGCSSLNSAQKHELAEQESDNLKIENKNVLYKTKDNNTIPVEVIKNGFVKQIKR